MKKVAVILLGSALVFMASAMLEEWETFRLLFVASLEKAAPVARTCSSEALQTIERFQSILVHVYRSGGDVRFLDRLPASENVKREIVSDLEYLVRNTRYQDMTIRKISIENSSPLGEGACEAFAREYWIVRYLDLGGNPLPDKPSAYVEQWRYVLRKGIAGWEVEWMEPIHEP